MQRVLLVDDTKTVLILLEMMLRESGYEISKVSNGEDALAAVGDGAADLVLLDVMMPGMNGVEVCRQIKSDASTRHVKVIMLTTKTDAALVSEAQEAGCDGYLSKPVARADLLGAVERCLAGSS